MHRLRVNGQVKVLESYPAPTDFTIGELAVRRARGCSRCACSPTSCGAREVGDLTGFSIGGSARRVPSPLLFRRRTARRADQPASEAAA